MPKRKRDTQKGSKRTKRSKTSHSKKSFKNKSNVLTLTGSNRIMPEVYHNIMEVFDTFSTELGTGGGTTSGVNYNANGLYDYSTQVGNPSVPGFAFMQPVYKYYRVKGVTLKFEAVNMSANPVYMQVHALKSGNSAFTTWADYRELNANKWCKTKLLSPTGSGDSRGILSLYIPFKEYIGSTYDTDVDWTGFTAAGGAVASNPDKIVTMTVLALSGDGTTVVANNALIINVSLTYYVEWFGLSPLPS